MYHVFPDVVAKSSVGETCVRQSQGMNFGEDLSWIRIRQHDLDEITGLRRVHFMIINMSYLDRITGFSIAYNSSSI